MRRAAMNCCVDAFVRFYARSIQCSCCFFHAGFCCTFFADTHKQNCYALCGISRESNIQPESRECPTRQAASSFSQISSIWRSLVVWISFAKNISLLITRTAVSGWDAKSEHAITKSSGKCAHDIPRRGNIDLYFCVPKRRDRNKREVEDRDCIVSDELDEFDQS